MRTVIFAKSSWFALTLAWGLVALIFILPLVRAEGYLWDFYAYYDSVMAFFNGLNPYTQKGLDEIYQSRNTLTFTYPPLTIYLFYPVIQLPAAVAAKFFYVFKAASLIGLLLVWHRWFLKLDWRNAPTVLFFVFAFNATLIWDMYANNITVIEQLLLWLGFACLLQKREWLFVVLVVVVAQFKLTPAAFLLLLLLVPSKPDYVKFAAGSVAFLLSQWLNYLIYPDYYIDFLLGAGNRAGQTGILNPSFHAFYKDAVIQFNQISLPFKLGWGQARTFTLMTLATVFAFSLYVIYIRRQRTTIDNEATGKLEIVLFFCLLHSLMHPRYKCYQYVQVLIPTLYFLRYMPNKAMVPFVVFFLFFPHHIGALNEPMASSPLPGPIRKISRLVFEYLPLFATLTIWWHYCRYLLIGGQPQKSSDA